MKWTEGEIDGVLIQSVKKNVDSRGWLAEVFRSDEVAPDRMPAMGYISVTHAGITRGPHAHRDQSDYFGFLGPGRFLLRLWDNRKESLTYGRTLNVVVGEDNPMTVSIPTGVVHGYKNVSNSDGLVFNCPNRLFAGEGRKEPIDDIRYEDDPEHLFSMED